MNDPTTDCLDVAGIGVSPLHFIGGRRVASAAAFDLFSPIDQRPLGRIAEGGEAEVDAAIRAAEHAFPAWAALGAEGRKPFLDRFAAEIGRRAEAFCMLESNDAGVLLSRMRHGVVPRAMLNISWFAEHALTLQERPLDTPQARHLVRHDPAGVVAIVTPWNAPLLLSTWKLGPALAAGNACVLKPPEWAPLTCSLLADAAEAAGLPPGVLNVVQGSGAHTGAKLVSDARLARISFTGSVPTGRWIAQAAGANLVPCSLELGGKSPFIVLEGADVDAAAATGAAARATAAATSPTRCPGTCTACPTPTAATRSWRWRSRPSRVSAAATTVPLPTRTWGATTPPSTSSSTCGWS